MRRIRTYRMLAGAAAIVAALALVHVLAACAIDAWSPDLGPVNGKDTSPAEFAAGHLGIIQAGAGVRDLVVAWRYLAGRPLSPEEQRQYAASPPQEQWIEGARQAPAETALNDWTAAVGQFFPQDAERPFNDQSWAPGIYRQASANNDFDTFLNCPEDAFRNAVATLNDREKRYRSEILVQQWIIAQEAVFANCSGPERSYTNRTAPPAVPQIPSPLPADAPALARADRDYQIAAAQLYAMQYPQAVAAFEAIGDDRPSPWRASAGYLASRAMVREATVQTGYHPATPARDFGLPTVNQQYELAWLAKAEAQVDAVLADKSDAAWWQPARKLRGFIELRLHPKRRALRLASKLAEPDDPTFRQDSTDLAYLAERGAGWSMRTQDPMLNWVELLPVYSGANDWAYSVDLAQWNQTHALPWLVAVLHAADEPGLPGVSELLSSAAAIAPSSPAFATVQYEMLRLERQAGPAGDAQVQAGIAKLPLADMTNATRNQFLALQLATAPTLEVALAAAPRVSNDGTWTGFDNDALALFNQALPLSLLTQAAQSSALPPRLHGQLLTAAWTRAVLLGDDSTVRVLSPQLQAAHPELAPDLASVLAPGPNQQQERWFAETWLLLHFPGMSPYVQERADWDGNQLALDQFDPDGADNWWDSFVPGNVTNTYQPPPFLTAPMVYVWLSQSQRINANGAAPDVLCLGVLGWVRSEPNDPRDAEALALAVAATARAHGDAQTGNLSKQCYDLLHAKYPNSEWAQKTTQWYKGYCGKYEDCQQ